MSICHVPGSVPGPVDTAAPKETEPFPHGTYISVKYYLASTMDQPCSNFNT